MRIDAHGSMAAANGPALASRTQANGPALASQTQATRRAPARRAAGSGPTAATLPPARRLAMPPLNQFALQETWWEARWRPALANAQAAATTRAGGRPDAALEVAPALRRLTKAVEQAITPGYPPTARNQLALTRAHREVTTALARAGAPRATLRALDRHRQVFVAWWQQSGRTACALAVEKLQQVSGGADTNFGKVIASFSRADARLTPWWPTLGTTAGVPARPKIYKNRRTTYTLAYDATRLRQAAATILGKLHGGQPVHVRVLTGYLHADAGPGRPPRSTHSLAIRGYQIEKTVAGQPVRIAFEFLDPDGGGKGTLVLDIEQQSFQHVPAAVGWVDTGVDGWDYDSLLPPHRYQVMSIR